MGVCCSCLRRPAKTHPQFAVSILPSEPAPDKDTKIHPVLLVDGVSLLPAEAAESKEDASITLAEEVDKGDQNDEEEDIDAESSSGTDESCPGEPVEAKWARAAKRQRKLARERRRAAKASKAITLADLVSPANGCVVSSFASLPHPQAQLDKYGCFDRQCFLIAGRAAFNDVYDVSVNLGKGTFGTVEKCRHKLTHDVRAIKTIPKKKIYDSSLLTREVDIIRLLEHPNIAKMYESFEDSICIYIVMEICEGGELFDHITENASGLPEAAVAHLMRQVSSAVCYMHQQHIAHRDLKPENFLLANAKQDLQKSIVKVIDFGFSTRFKPGSFMKTMASTPHYVAPEVIAGQYTQTCDVWSLGVVFYVLLSGAVPFFGTSEKDIFSKIAAGMYDFNGSDAWPRVADISKDLIKSTLVMDPTLRLPIQNILEHPFLKRTPPEDEVSSLVSIIWQRLESFQKISTLKKALLTALAQQLTEASVLQLRTVFEFLDSNSDGVLSREELVHMRVADGVTDLPDSRGASSVPETFDDLVFDSIDTDGSGAVEYTEFLAAAIDHKLHLDKSSVGAAFRVFDLNGDGKVSKDEMAILLSRGLACTLHACASDLREDIEKTMEEADNDGDGCLNFEEFQALLRQSCMRESAYDRAGRGL